MIEYCDNNTMVTNTLQNNLEIGIHIINSTGATIDSNIISQNDIGILIEQSVNVSSLLNIVNDNKIVGIYLLSTNQTSVDSDILNNNSFY